MEETISEYSSQAKKYEAENQSLKQKVHILSQSATGTTNEINFFNGKINTLQRDLRMAQDFSENLQSTNKAQLEELEN